MNYTLQSRIDLFTQNFETARQGFTWKSTLIKRLVALLYANQNQVFDGEAVRRGLELIKMNTGVFSTFRGNSSLTIAAMLALTPDPAQMIRDVLTVYEHMRRSGFHASDYLTIAAFLIVRLAGPDAASGAGAPSAYDLADQPAGYGSDNASAGECRDTWRNARSAADRFGPVVTRTRAFYDGMKSAHPFITGQDDYIFAAMLGLSDLELTCGLTRIEQLYTDLKRNLRGSNTIQALAQVLALGGGDTGLTGRVLGLADGFRTAGLPLDREYTLPSLGVLSLLPQDKDTIVSTVRDAYDYLYRQPRFGIWSLQKQERLLYAVSLFIAESADAVQDGLLQSTLSTSITSILIAQQAAATAAIAASAAAASSASSSSN